MLFKNHGDFAKTRTYTRSQRRPCIYYWKKKDRILILLIYVDDILITSNDKQKIQELVE